MHPSKIRESVSIINHKAPPRKYPGGALGFYRGDRICIRRDIMFIEIPAYFHSTIRK